MPTPLLMFTWTDVRDALETLAETSQQRRAGWLLERLKQESRGMRPGDLLVEIISTAVLLGAESSTAETGLPSLLDG